MKKLTLIRHAKSDHASPAFTDFERPLSLRGLRDAPLIGRHLRTEYALAPDVIIASPALRTLTTARMICKELGIDESLIQTERRIYEAPLRFLLDVIRAIPDSVSHAVMVGHNPGFESLANWLCGPGTIDQLPTGGVVMVELPVERWTDVVPLGGSLLNYFYPAAIGGGKEAHGG